MAFTPAIYVDRARCIGCNSCSLACKQENNVPIGTRWNEVYQYEEGSYPTPRAQVFALTFDQCTMCAHRLAVGLQPACVITCMGITREFGDYETLKAKYDGAGPQHMENGAKETVLYGHLGSEPSWTRNPPPPTGYIPANDCRQCHRSGD
ncbi:MAG TPA: 4Fe-4S dicluster domain-containing protein [Verrucomicrobiae bacterium]